MSRITIVVDVDSAPLEQIVKQLFKLIDVVKISELDPRRSRRARAAARHRAGTGRQPPPGGRADQHLRGQDPRGRPSMRVTLSLEGHPDKLDDFEELLAGYGIVELQRTGRVALPKLDRGAHLRAVNCLQQRKERWAEMAANVYYEKDADPSMIRSQEGGDHRLRLAGPCPRAQPQGLGRRGVRRPARRLVVEDQGRERRPHGEVDGRRRRSGPTSIMILAPDTEQKKIFDEHIAAGLEPGNALAFAHGFNVRFGRIQAPEGVDCDHDRPEGPRPPGPAHLHRGRRRARPDRRRPGRHRAAPRRSRCRTPRRSAAPAPA